MIGRNAFALMTAIALIAGCTNTMDTESVPGDTDTVARQLEQMGFEPAAASISTTADIAEGQTATPYRHADGRTALLVRDAAGAEIHGLVFDAWGEVEATLYSDAETAYYECWTCEVFYWSCYGSCVLPCWSTDGLGQGCHFDCSTGCDGFTQYVCEPVHCGS